MKPQTNPTAAALSERAQIQSLTISQRTREAIALYWRWRHLYDDAADFVAYVGEEPAATDAIMNETYKELGEKLKDANQFFENLVSSEILEKLMFFDCTEI